MSVSGRTLLVGGLSSIHDPLAAAALRGWGLAAEALPPRTDAGLRRARSLGNHGQCNPAHYGVGAVLEHARRSGLPAAEFAERFTWLTVGSCGPCRLAAFGLEYQRVLAGAGLGGLALEVVEQLCFVDGAPGERLGVGPARALLRALVAGDTVASLSHWLRPYVLEPARLDATLARGVAELVVALEQRAPLVPLLAALGAASRAVPSDWGRASPRVLLVGEPWTTLTDGDPSYDLARRMEELGAEVDAPTASDWLCFRLWEARRDAPDRAASAVLRRAEGRVRGLFRTFTAAAGLPGARLSRHDLLSRLAGPLFDPRVRGGSAHLEVARALVAAREHAVHLVLSLKPFGCMPSSAVSDGVLGGALRERALPFVALETTGDGHAAADSRVEMALHAATLAALDELDAACASRGLARDEALAVLRQAGPRLPSGRRTYACRAAELIRRGVELGLSRGPTPRGGAAPG